MLKHSLPNVLLIYTDAKHWNVFFFFTYLHKYICIFFKCIFSLYVTFSTELRNYPTLENIHISFYLRLSYLG